MYGKLVEENQRLTKVGKEMKLAIGRLEKSLEERDKEREGKSEEQEKVNQKDL